MKIETHTIQIWACLLIQIPVHAVIQSTSTMKLPYRTTKIPGKVRNWHTTQKTVQTTEDESPTTDIIIGKPKLLEKGKYAVVERPRPFQIHTTPNSLTVPGKNKTTKKFAVPRGRKIVFSIYKPLVINVTEKENPGEQMESDEKVEKDTVQKRKIRLQQDPDLDPLQYEGSLPPPTEKKYTSQVQEQQNDFSFLKPETNFGWLQNLREPTKDEEFDFSKSSFFPDFNIPVFAAPKKFHENNEIAMDDDPGKDFFQHFPIMYSGFQPNTSPYGKEEEEENSEDSLIEPVRDEKTNLILYRPKDFTNDNRKDDGVLYHKEEPETDTKIEDFQENVTTEQPKFDFSHFFKPQKPQNTFKTRQSIHDFTNFLFEPLNTGNFQNQYKVVEDFFEGDEEEVNHSERKARQQNESKNHSSLIVEKEIKNGKVKKESDYVKKVIHQKKKQNLRLVKRLPKRLIQTTKLQLKEKEEN